MVKYQREELKGRLRSGAAGGAETKRVNYFKLNQGYDMCGEDSEYSKDNEVLPNKCKKIKKTKHSKKELIHHDNLEILLNWKKNIQMTPYEHDSKKIQQPKKIIGTDLSQFAHNIQGILINGQYKKEYKQLDLNKKLLSNGIVFLWSDKQLLNEIIEGMEQKGFVYIENLVVVQLSLKAAYEQLSKRITLEYSEEAILNNLHILQENVGVKELMSTRENGIFNQSKQVLLMFRRFDDVKTQLELRHQRTPDVLFDLCDELGSPRTKEYIYQTIETLLPKAQLMEIFADASKARKGWISVCGTK